MSFFTPDLYRRIALGFVLGAVLVGAANAGYWSEQIAPPAKAAPMPQESPVAPEFLIEPLP